MKQARKQAIATEPLKQTCDDDGPFGLGRREWLQVLQNRGHQFRHRRVDVHRS